MLKRPEEDTWSFYFPLVHWLNCTLMEKTSVIKLLILHTPKKSDKGKHYLNLSGKGNVNADLIVFSSKVMQMTAAVGRSFQNWQSNWIWLREKKYLNSRTSQDRQTSLIFPDALRSTHIRNNIVRGRIVKMQRFQMLTHQSGCRPQPASPEATLRSRTGSHLCKAYSEHSQVKSHSHPCHSVSD